MVAWSAIEGCVGGNVQQIEGATTHRGLGDVVPFFVGSQSGLMRCQRWVGKRHTFNCVILANIRCVILLKGLSNWDRGKGRNAILQLWV